MTINDNDSNEIFEPSKKKDNIPVKMINKADFLFFIDILSNNTAENMSDNNWICELDSKTR